MANVNVKFNNKDYLLSCDDGQEESLKSLTKFLDKKYEIYRDDDDLIFSGQYGLIEENNFFIAQINEPGVDLKGAKFNLGIKRPENTYKSILSKLNTITEKFDSGLKETLFS